MTHPIIELQTTLIAALNADVQLIDLLGSEAIFDAPPKGKKPPFVAIIHHDISPRDADETPGNDHRVLLNIRHNHVSRKAVLEIAERVIYVALNADLNSANLQITHALHLKTQTRIDNKSSTSLATIAMRFLSEPI